MLQRIQTIYLVASLLLSVMLFRLPIADLLAGGKVMLFTIAGLFSEGELVFSGLPLQILLGIIVLLHLVAIFSYKNRIRQMRLLGFTIFTMLGMFGMFFYFAYASFEQVTVGFKLYVVIPVVASVIDYLAIRNIGKDEALVRSIDRLRR